MWEITISPSSRKKAHQFNPFSVKYNTRKEAEKARWALIDIATCTGMIAPCDAETGNEEVIFTHLPWSVGNITEC